MCGEHLSASFFSCLGFGSSPRVRGTPKNIRTDFLRARFIPACAGNTSQCPTGSPDDAVHPRVCGEHILTLTLDFADHGSSPRVRGTPISDELGDGVERFIPACAGNTQNISSHNSAKSVHPRVCGEHRDVQPYFDKISGSSPRVRGTLGATLIHALE